MNSIQTLPDIPPELRRPVRYDTGDCKHWQRRFVDWPEEPKRGDKIVYHCQDCGRKRAMTI